VYTSSDPDATLAQASLYSSNADTSFTYTPLPGMRWQWQQTAFLKRDITLNALGADPTVGAWYFADPNGNSLGINPATPWYYADTFDPSFAVPTSNGTLFLYNGRVLTQDPAHAGTLLMGQSENLPYMQETITGNGEIRGDHRRRRRLHLSERRALRHAGAGRLRQLHIPEEFQFPSGFLRVPKRGQLLGHGLFRFWHRHHDDVGEGR
jgi:hypothetical protein